jgi:hypothetical protein
MSMTSRFWFTAALVLLACNAKADAPSALKPDVVTEWVGKTPRANIYRLRDDGRVCYVVERVFDNSAISCVTEESR